MITSPVVRPDPKRKWYGLALRHIRMARRLLNSGFSDGATFHAYHAYECVLSAFIAASGYSVPPDGWTKLVPPSGGKPVRLYPSPKGGFQENSAHKARIKFFIDLADSTKPYFPLHNSLQRYLALSVRMDALYYDTKNDKLPYQEFNYSFAINVIPQVHLFAKAVWKEIR